MTKIKCVDLFSGIGGIALGLREFADTRLYCEKDRFCQSVLASRMRDRSIDRAPVHHDISTLQLTDDTDVEMLSGGFPCQDISSIGLQRGIAGGARSGLFYDIVRVLDDSPSIKIVFLENVSNILKCGLSEVLNAFAQRGWSTQWTLMSASGLGASHRRARWFMLAVRDDDALARVAQALAASPTDPTEAGATAAVFAEEPPVRVELHANSGLDPTGPFTTAEPQWIQRMQTLGNSVVPCVVTAAFRYLARSSRSWDAYADMTADNAIALDAFGGGGGGGGGEFDFPENGIMIGSKVYPLAKRYPRCERQVRPSVHMPVPGTDSESKLDFYPTPRRGITHASSLSERSVRDLPTILVYCRETREALTSAGVTLPAERPMHSLLTPSARYVEWLMGYPRDWTRAESYEARPPALDPGDEDADDDDGVASSKRSRRRRTTASSSAPRRYRLNGMHMFMRDHPGLGVVEVSRLWNALDEQERQRYSGLASSEQCRPMTAAAATAQPVACV